MRVVRKEYELMEDDSLKERLRNAGLRDGFAIIFYKDVQEALARIEELEAEKKVIGLEGEMLLAIAFTTIAKLEAENVRLQQESNYWQMAAMHANEREEEMIARAALSTAGKKNK